jgi:methionyl-tRNA formyltransferase
MPLRLIFMGTPDFAVPTLRALHDQGQEIVAVYTRAPKPSGRGLKLQPTPVEMEARRFGIPVLTPKTLRTPEALEEFQRFEAHAAVVVAYGLILPRAILDAPKCGCFNLHASLLPHWRGAAPINRAIMAGDEKSGVMVMKMDEGLDTGEVAITNRRQVVRITNKMSAGDLHDKLAALGAGNMAWAMGQLERGKLEFKKQEDQKLPYATKIEKAEALINWDQKRLTVLRHINGLSPFPGAWSEVRAEGESIRLKILRCSLLPGKPRKSLPTAGTVLDDHLAIACGDGAIRILELQRAGKAPMRAEDFLRGTPLKPPMRLA